MRYHAQRNDPQSLYWAELAAARYAAPAYYHLARHHQRQGDVATAIEQYEKAAALGVTAACWQLGQIYFYGTGISPDQAQAEHYLEQAAQTGHIAAQTLLADLLAAQRKSEALEWYRRAADKEQAEAQAKLAQYALTGELSERDPFQAARYAKAAAEKNHPEALKIMGDLYRYGLGIKADNHIAHDYYHRAAALGSAAAAQKLISDAALYHPQQYEQIKTAALQQQQTETIYRLAEAQAHAIGRPADYNAARKNYMKLPSSTIKNAAAALRPHLPLRPRYSARPSGGCTLVRHRCRTKPPFRPIPPRLFLLSRARCLLSCSNRLLLATGRHQQRPHFGRIINIPIRTMAPRSAPCHRAKGRLKRFTHAFFDNL